jgi:threonine/homoserine/homoserine lactone efflux protein
MTEKILLVIGVTTLCVLSPGPDMILVMRNTLTRDLAWGQGRVTASEIALVPTSEWIRQINGSASGISS